MTYRFSNDDHTPREIAQAWLRALVGGIAIWILVGIVGGALWIGHDDTARIISGAPQQRTNEASFPFVPAPRDAS